MAQRLDGKVQQEILSVTVKQVQWKCNENDQLE